MFYSVRKSIWVFSLIAFYFGPFSNSWGKSGENLDEVVQTRWLVRVDGEARDRTLQLLSNIVESGQGIYQLSGVYGYIDGAQKPVAVTLKIIDGKKTIDFDTPADSKISVEQIGPSRFRGIFVGLKGKAKAVSLELLSHGKEQAGLAAKIDEPKLATAGTTQKNIHLVWMGGNDCPPCVVWRATELPKLKQSPEFSNIRFSYVIKAIQGTVPPLVFLPDDVKPYKDILDVASGGGMGSPQAALLVDGVVFDYFWGTRSAADIEKMIISVRQGGAYPFNRCTKMHRMGRSCVQNG